MTPPFVSPLNFLDPPSKSERMKRYKELVKGRYQISKYINTSYIDAGEMHPLERDYVIGFITEEMEQQQKAIEEAKNKK